MRRNRAVFLDRDGVINELIYHQEAGIIDSPFTLEQFNLLAWAGEAIRIMKKLGFKVVVVSNQPGVAKNHYTEETLGKIDTRMRQELSAQGASLDGVYYCLHHPEAKNTAYAARCSCRKPKPGLLLRAARELGVDLLQSYMVGDNLTDVQAGHAAGCRTILVGKMKCEMCNMMEHTGVKPHLIRENLLHAARAIVELESGLLPEPRPCHQEVLR